MKQPNIIFINTDQQSWDAYSAAGNDWATTSNIDRLFAAGTAFTRCYATNPVCSPARSSWASGRYSSETGCPFNGGLMHKDIPDIGQILRTAGYETYHAGKWHVDGRDVHDGFDVLYFGGRPIVAGGAEYYDGATTRAVMDFLTRRTSAHPFYLQVGLINPHDICEFGHAHEHNTIPDPIQQGILKESDLPPLPRNFNFDRPETVVQETFRRSEQAVVHPRILVRTRGWSDLDWRYLAWMYYRFVEQVDAQIGLILNTLITTGMADTTLIVFGSDHGEAAGRHQMFQKFTLYEESVRVPLVILPPASLGPATTQRDSSSPVSGVDLFATICDYAGARIPAETHGRSLRPVIDTIDTRAGSETPRHNPRGSARETVFVENNYWERAVIGPRYKLITEYIPNEGDECVPPSIKTHRLGRLQLFDLEADPWEQRNIAHEAAQQSIVSEYLDHLTTHEAALERRPLREGSPRTVVESYLPLLRAAHRG